MLIHIHDSSLRRVAFLDNEKPGALHYYGDTWHRYLKEATSTFDFTVPKADHETLQHLTDKSYISFRYGYKDYLFSVLRIEETEREITCFCENLNLELLNEQAAKYEAASAMSFAQYFNDASLIGGMKYTDLLIGINEVEGTTLKLMWEGSDTKLARLLSLVHKFDAECEFVTKLNRDGSLDHIAVNVYKKHDEKHQGVGTRRQDVTLFYGKAIRGIRRTIDKTGLYSAIQPIGKEGLTISSIDKKEYDSKGRTEFYTTSGSPNIYAPLTAQDYPPQFASKDDPWVLYRWEYDTDNVNTLYGQALAKLKALCRPMITYEVEGSFDLEIGDTVKIHDEKFVPTLILEARVSEQEVCFSDPTKNKTKFSNFRALEDKTSADMLARLAELLDASKPYRLELVSTEGTVFKNGLGSSTVTAKVFRGDRDVSGEVDFLWTKGGIGGMPISETQTVTVAASGFDQKMVYRLEVKNGDGLVVAVTEVTFVNVRDGASGKEYTKIEDEFYLSTSSEVPEGGEWRSTCPPYEAGKFYFTRTKFTYDTDNADYSVPYLFSGLTDANATAVAASARAEAVRVKIGDLEAENVTIKGDLTAQNTRVANLEATNVAISGRIQAAEATITDLTAANVSITGRLTSAEGTIGTLTADNVTIKGDLSTVTATVQTLSADVAATGTLLAGKADIDLANVKAGSITTAMIGTGVIGTTQIADGSITDAKIVGLTANKITAGRLDAASIEVVNLNAANITVGTINGTQIAPGAVDLSNLSGVVSGIITGAAQKIYHTTSGTGGQFGYFHLCTIRIKGAYQNQPLSISVVNRGQLPSTVWVTFANQNSTDPSLESIKKSGDANFYIARSDPGTWKLFVQKSDRYDALSVIEFKQGAYGANGVNITWESMQVDSLPDGYTMASQMVASAEWCYNNDIAYINGGKIYAATVAAQQIAAGAITADKIVSGAVTADKLAANSVTANAIAAGSITATNGKIVSIDAGKITTGFLDAARIRAGSLTVGLFDDSTQAKVTAGETALSNVESVSANLADNYTDTATLNQTLSEVQSDISKASIANWAYDGNVTYIDGGRIFTGTIDATKINATSLSAISSDLGTITTGKIQSTGYGSGSGLMMDFSGGADGIEVKSTVKNTTLKIDADGTRVYANDDLQGAPRAQFTDKGTETKELFVSDSAQIAGLLVSRKPDGEIWITGVV